MDFSQDGWIYSNLCFWLGLLLGLYGFIRLKTSSNLPMTMGYGFTAVSTVQFGDWVIELVPIIRTNPQSYYGFFPGRLNLFKSVFLAWPPFGPIWVYTIENELRSTDDNGRPSHPIYGIYGLTVVSAGQSVDCSGNCLMKSKQGLLLFLVWPIISTGWYCVRTCEAITVLSQ